MTTKIDCAALRQCIKEIGGLTDDERAALLELTSTKRYGLVWEEREEDVEERLREELPVLVEDKELRIIGCSDERKSGESDNPEVRKSENPEHELPRIDHELMSDNSRIINGNSCENKIKIYVFSPGAYAWDDDFAPVIDRVELCALPEAIYQAYKNVLPKKKARRETVEESPKEGGEK